MRYIPNSSSAFTGMLESIGLKNTTELFKSIPDNLILDSNLALPAPQTESELIQTFKKLAAQNYTPDEHLSFLGAGVYNHIKPLVIDSLISRSEFYTSYTPYQPEINQGTVHSIFEFQSLICQLTGMEVANASMYDGSTALAEAALMSIRLSGRRKVICAGAIHPEYLDVVKIYLEHADAQLEHTEWDSSGKISLEKLTIDSSVAALVVQSPNFFGCIEDVEKLVKVAHQSGTLLILCITEMISLALLKTPGEVGVDIVVGEAQSFGLPQSYGGPFLGLFATREQFQRQMPGRIVGQSVDKHGDRCFTITMATREQHIRREKATSNICTNQALCALAASIYLCIMGRQGLQEIASRNVQNAVYLLNEISTIPGFEQTFSKTPIFNEFVITTPIPARKLIDNLSVHGIVGGLSLDKYYPNQANQLLVCATENTSLNAINHFVDLLRKVSCDR